MDHIDKLFLKTLEDIENRITSEDSYELLGASALLRKLLFDDYPLVDQVNRTRKFKIHFEIACQDYSEYLSQLEELGIPEPMFYIVPEGLDCSPYPRRTVKRDQFFRTVVLSISGRRYTVRDIVVLLANVMGGVHAGSPRNDREKTIFPNVNHDKYVSEFGSHPGPLYLLRSIGRVVLRALQPLRESIKDNTTR